MKSNITHYVLTSLVLLAACAKDAKEIVPLPEEPVDTTQVVNRVPPPCVPNYGSEVLCETQDKTIFTPLNFPGKGKGTYVSFPEGLVIDKYTGAIDVKNSESGMAYEVGFIPKDSKDTCFTRIVIGGVTYMDKVYVLSDNDTMAAPIYNGDMNAGPACGPNAAFAGCEFDDDEDDDNGNGYADEPPTGSGCFNKGLHVEKKTGKLRLKRSLLGGLFGRTPTQGETVTVILYYRIDDCSNKALRKLKIKFTYYRRYRDVPVTLLNEVKTAADNLIELLQGRYQSNPRPPHVIVVANRN